jgi:hypothetical protein
MAVVNEVTLSEKNPALLIIPPNLYHGWKNIGTNEAIIINMPTAMYNYEAPDALDLPWVRSVPSGCNAFHCAPQVGTFAAKLSPLVGSRP